MQMEHSPVITFPRYDETLFHERQRERERDTTSSSSNKCTHNHSSSLKGRALQPMNVTHQHANLTHSLIDAYGRCRCSTVRDDQHKPIQSRTGISIGIIIITTSDYLRILTHTNTVGMLVHQTTMLRPNIAINLFHWDSGTRQEVRD